MSKYEVDSFVSPPDPDLICCICRSVLYRPLESPCQHVFCKVCIRTWLGEHHSCPNCRHHLSISQLKPVLPIVRNMINRLQLRCKNETQGCNKGIKLEHYDRHVQDCDYGLVGCLNSGCVKNVLRKDMLRHEKECPHRLVNCKKGCGLPVTAAGIRDHSCIQSLKKTMEAKEDGFIKRLNDIEKRLMGSIERLESRIAELEYETRYREEERHSRMRRRDDSRSRSRSHSRSTIRSRSLSPRSPTLTPSPRVSRSPSPEFTYSYNSSPSYSHSPSYSRSPSFRSDSRSYSSSPSHRESPRDMYQDWYSASGEESWDYVTEEDNRDRALEFDEDPWIDESPEDLLRPHSPYPESTSSPEPPSLEVVERTSTSRTLIQYFAPATGRNGRSNSGLVVPTTNNSNQIETHPQQADRVLNTTWTLNASEQATDRNQSTTQNPTVSGQADNIDESAERVGTDRSDNQTSRAGASLGADDSIHGTLYGVEVGDTDSEDVEWMPNDERASSNSSPSSPRDVDDDDDGRNLSGYDSPENNPTTTGNRRVTRSTRSQNVRPVDESRDDISPEDRPGTSRSSAGPADTTDRQANEPQPEQQTSRGNRRRRRETDLEESLPERRRAKRKR